MKIVVGITGASGSLYARLLVESLLAEKVEVATVLSRSAPEVWAHEIGGDVRAWLVDEKVPLFEGRDYRAPFASGSAKWDAMVVVPCSMSALARIAHGISDDLLARAADVMLKERRRLILVARETPLSEIHLANMLAVTRAGGMVLPATPSFYQRPQSVEEVARTVTSRILDHLAVRDAHAKRWGEKA